MEYGPERSMMGSRGELPAASRHLSLVQVKISKAGSKGLAAGTVEITGKAGSSNPARSGSKARPSACRG